MVIREEEKSFMEAAHRKREELSFRGSEDNGNLGRGGSATELYVNENLGVAVIGVLTRRSDGGSHDTIYTFRQSGELVEILDQPTNNGRINI